MWILGLEGLKWFQTRLILCSLCFLILTTCIIIQNQECKLGIGGNENKVPGNNKDIFVFFFLFLEPLDFP